MRQGFLADVDADRCAWRYRLGEADGNRARTAPTVNESHSRSQVRREKRTYPAAAGMYGAAPLVFYLIRALGARPLIRHAHPPYRNKERP
jgi:hypothetical protein